jgi:DNA-binding MarR family transcriptional regulator
LLRTVSFLLRIFEQELQESEGLPFTWYDVLIQFNESPDGQLRIQTIADRVVLSRSGLTRLIDRMEKAGLVRMEPSQEDRRGYYAMLMKNGREVLGRAKPIHHRGIYEHFTRHLDKGDVQALGIDLTKIQKALRHLMPTAVESGLTVASTGMALVVPYRHTFDPAL